MDRAESLITVATASCYFGGISSTSKSTSMHVKTTSLGMLSVVLLSVACRSGSPTVAPDATDCCTGRTIYEVPELTEAPQFPGGELAMYTWLGNRLERPAGTQDVEEPPLIQFNVDCQGQLRDIAVKVPAHPELDTLAIQAVRKMPTWSPGRIKDKVVCTFYVLPVRFE